MTINTALCNCRVFPTQAPDLSFMHIYGQRVQVPGAIIIDGVYPLLVVLVLLSQNCLSYLHSILFSARRDFCLCI